MERSVDSMGRIVIPSEYRKQLHINDGDLINIEVSGSNIILSKVDHRPSDIRRVMCFHLDEMQVDEIKSKYPRGTIVECIEMSGDTAVVPSGTRGVVSDVDDVGTIQVCWENGSTFSLISTKDRFKIVK